MRQVNLYKKVYGMLRQIPKGKATTYKALAVALGDENAARAIGRILHNNKNLVKFPCYKVVESDGGLGGYSLGADEKIKRLKNDGIEIKNKKIQSFEKILFRDFKTDFPLKKLRQEQLRLRNKIIIEKPELPKELKVAGIDVSYRNNRGKCAYVLMNKNFEVLEEKTTRMEINFPYISTYLSYRELPIILKLMKSVKKMPDVLLVDGNGLLHPRSMGIATHAGILLNMRTVGVAKSLLFGKIENGFVKYENKILAKVLQFNGKPVYVSVGHKIDLKTSIEIVKLFTNSRIPEPLKMADRLSRL
ncbi:MAG: endonuclease V [Candidatus Aenigmarchaeota archaeon]|nr:endonuclease V [Candidatus Aenigmarchaeota archaeon]